MPIISTQAEHLTVLNLFTTDAPDKQDTLIQEMTKIVQAAAYEGWMSSTVHSGVDAPGTANLIQWRSGEDLEKRYAGEEFKHRTLPVFGEITTSIRLLQNEIAYTLTHPSLGGVLEVSPDRDDYTAITVYGVAQENQAELIDALGPAQAGITDAPGFRSLAVFKGLRARGVDGAFVVRYEQWDSKQSYDAHLALPKDKWPSGRQKAEARIQAVATSVDSNTYRVVLTRAAG
ncbi:antibiotic biosynthesis monooxygenase family protein [Actinacidiphila acididurans]|uniref:Antibiotic biosynthesis monooxygenase n=1 Tax=Actinacidiphila acididurans TaxID=2784346 RepID=A0ABS2TSX9_9ACTN|nr:antibiotic biosynthesis monooxygenase family protein [Actinacidiphila acididurans]MBM9506443.1 antibiotic biosynthesis monooxygenase [Actinacidiphila acididurans]